MKKNSFTIVTMKGVLVYSLVWFLAMCFIDCIVPVLSKIPHRISGEIWFQMINSWLLAIPSMVIGAYALFQTNYLEKERMKPVLWMHTAELTMRMVNWDSFKIFEHDVLSVEEQNVYMEYRNDYGEYKNLGVLNLKASLILKSGCSIVGITFVKVEIEIGTQKYILKFDEKKTQIKRGEHQNIHHILRCDFVNGQERYDVEWMLNFFEIEKRDVELKEFWDNMYAAIVACDYDVSKREIELKIFVKIGYEIDSVCKLNESDMCWKVKYDGEKRKHINEYTSKRISQAGIIRYIEGIDL